MFISHLENIKDNVVRKWRAQNDKNTVIRVFLIAGDVIFTVARKIASKIRLHILRPIYMFASKYFFRMVSPLNRLLSILRRNIKYENSVLHISYMVHISYYTTRTLRKHGMKADYLAVGCKSPWWDKYDYNFPHSAPWQEFYFFWKVVAKYEIIHSHFGIMLSASGWELPILKRMGRKIVLNYRGCEARDPEKNMKLWPDNNICQACDYDKSVCREGKKRIAIIRKYADISLATTPDINDFVPEAIHFPFFAPEIDHKRYTAKNKNRGDEIKIVHVTNHPGIEGTDRIMKAIDRLKGKGHKINFVFLRGVTPEKVLEEYRDADLSIGKMKMGYYANAQIESMLLGVPAVAYVRPQFMTPALKNSGFIITDPARLEQTLEYYLDHQEELKDKQRIARDTIIRLHDNDKLARRLIGLYGDIKTQKKYIDWSPRQGPLRVLHIGNIANNAYYNAKFLRQAGVEADVLCYDNYWVMSSPEWEEADFKGVPANQFYPNWEALGIKGYQRPRWFVQGPLEMCVNYLLARQQGRTDEAERLWKRLTAVRQLLCGSFYAKLFESVRALKRYIPNYSKFQNSVHRIGGEAADIGFHEEYIRHCHMLIDEFKSRFPERPDQLTLEDMMPYESKVRILKKLFNYYDIIEGYSVDALYPMLAGFKPYVAFEHGTLRDSPSAKWAYKGPSQDSSLARLTALSYSMADHVFITNADCLEEAKKLRLDNFEPMPHPFDENAFFIAEYRRDAIRAQLKTDLILLCPIRHDWIDKGTDKYIRAIPELRQRIGRKFKVCFMPWGQEVEKSRKLISALGCEDLVSWVGPFGGAQFKYWLSAADVVFDQIAYSSFSGITPRALAAGTPVIISYDQGVGSWMFPEPPPLLPAWSTEDIVKQTLIAISPGFRQGYKEQAQSWIQRYHSSEKVVKQMCDAYNAIMPQRAQEKTLNIPEFV
ncbi:MAG: glycosyltransferase [Candidatus Omnitrophica bacterium]|nr:glycosyltransferase [Candidatus Omnitrophota bacterium]